jgi:soluble lytic murein transglycosylase
MRKTFLWPVVALSLIAHVSRAQVVEEKLTWNNAKQPAASKASSLQQQKKSEIEKKWTDCATQGKTNLTRFAAVKGWVLISWLHCAREIAVEKKSGEALLAPLKVLDAQPQLLLAGPWKNSLWTESVRSRQIAIDQLAKSKPDEAWKQVETLLETRDQLDKSQRAKVLMSAGELAQAKAQTKAARFFYEQSLSEQDNRTTRDKLSSLLFALNEKPTEEKPKPETIAPETEGNFEERFRASMRANDLVSLLEDCVTYLKQFPGGRRAKWAQEKVIDVYNSFVDQGKDEKLGALRDRALTIMEKADSSRILEWARQMHRKGDYKGCLRLSEKALESLSASSSGGVLVYLAGRCAQFTGEYKTARKHFETYVEQFSGGEDTPEVLFRLGLVHLRMSQASSAIAVFERLLLMKGIDRYELNARYWLARSLQATNNTRALQAVDDLLSKYPFSYYGLRLRMERSAGLMEWPTELRAAQDLKASYFLTTAQKKTLTRAETLAQNGWIAEALAEVGGAPVPTEAAVKVLLAHRFNQLELFPPVIRLVNEAGDLNPDFKSLDVIQLSLPQVYKDAINEQALKQKLSPYLVRSLIRQESAFGPRAISTSNAYGLMQLIGPTAQEVATELGLRGISIPEDIYVPENNIQMGTFYLAKVLKQYQGNVPMGLAAYNAGPHRLRNFVDGRKEVSSQMQKFSSDPWDEMWFDELPWSETSFYVKAILRNAILYQLADKASAKEPDQRRVQFGSVLWSQLVIQP